MGYSISYTASGDKINFIDLKEKLTDKELAIKLGRTVGSIQVKRNRLLKKGNK